MKHLEHDSEIVAMRPGLTVEPGTYMVGSDWVTGAVLRGIDHSHNAFLLVLSPDDLGFLLEYAKDVVSDQEAAERQADAKAERELAKTS